MANTFGARKESYYDKNKTNTIGEYSRTTKKLPSRNPKAVKSSTDKPVPITHLERGSKSSLLNKEIIITNQ